MARVWKFLKAYWPALFVGLAFLAVNRFIVESRYPEAKPDAVLVCNLQPQDRANPPPIGNYSGRLQVMQLDGFLRKSSQPTLYDFDGSARYLIGDQWIKAPMRGSVFVDDRLEPRGFILSISDRKISPDEITIVTLNDRGTLDFSYDTAFFVSDRARRLSIPLSMHCGTAAPPPQSDWLGLF